MTNFDLRFRQRLVGGKYHFWGDVGATWIQPKNEYGDNAVLPHHSEQWTGLKDRLGADVYVGDVLEHGKGFTEVVVSEKGGFLTKDRLDEQEGCGGSMWMNRKFIEENCKIIGNVGDVFYPAIKNKKHDDKNKI